MRIRVSVSREKVGLGFHHQEATIGRELCSGFPFRQLCALQFARTPPLPLASLHQQLRSAVIQNCDRAGNVLTLALVTCFHACLGPRACVSLGVMQSPCQDHSLEKKNVLKE